METIAVIFGGRSTEHDVSIVTALASVVKPLELSGKYRVEAVYIAKDGSWHWGDVFKDINLFTSGKIEAILAKDQSAGVQFNGGMVLTKPSGLGRLRTQPVDVAFPAMHGTYGEDGALMGLLDMAGIAYVGCGLAASAAAMDKVVAKELAVQHGIPTAAFVTSTKQLVATELAAEVKRIQAALVYPLFVKPAHLGSSIGISRVTNQTELTNALEVAAHYDDKIVIEQAIGNLIEVTLPIMGNDDLRPALLERPLTKAEDFFDFETKYMQGGKGKGKGKGKGGGKLGAQGYSQLPADLPTDVYVQAQTVGLSVFKMLGCSGIARVDMLIDSVSQQVYFNEVNPLPGDLYAHNWRAAGVSGVELVDTLVELAKQRQAQRTALSTSFGTNYLKQF